MDRDDLIYTNTHEWVQLYKNNIARIGVTDIAQKRFGNVLFVDLPELDIDHEQFDSCAVIEGDNMLCEVSAPVSGRVVNVNEELDDDPSIINHDPYGDGWILELEIVNETELDRLMSFEEYQDFLAGEEGEDA